MDRRATVTTDIFGSPNVITDYSYNKDGFVKDSRTNPVIVIPVEKYSCIIPQVINIFLIFYEYRRFIAVFTRVCCWTLPSVHNLHYNTLLPHQRKVCFSAVPWLKWLVAGHELRLPILYSRQTLYRICDGKGDNDRGFSLSTSAFPSKYYSTRTNIPNTDAPWP